MQVLLFKYLFLLLFGCVLVRLEAIDLKWLQDLSIALQCGSLVILLKLSLALELLKKLEARSVEPAHISLSLLDLNEFFEIPSKFLCDIIIIGHVPHVNEVVVEHSGQNVTIVNVGVPSDVKVVIGAMIQVDSVLVAVSDHLCLVEIFVVDYLRFPV